MADPARPFFDLTGARALVTGAGRGIGAAVARALARHGAAVALAARSTDELEQVASEITADGGVAVPHPVDITDDRSVADLAAWAPTALGGSVDVLVNNAGIYAPNRFGDYAIEDWTRILDVNVVGLVRVTRAFLPAMESAGRGRIINMASTAGRYGSMNQSAYNASKHAVVGITRCLALETAAVGVRVNAICPGFVDTDLLTGSTLGEVLGLDDTGVRSMMADRTPIGRVVTPEEVAALTVYLAAPEADAMTGVALTLAGGLVLI